MNGLLPVAFDGERLCVAIEGGSIRYRKEDAASEARTTALDKVTEVVGVTAEYMKQMEAVPILKAGGLSEEFKLLADFNGSSWQVRRRNTASGWSPGIGPTTRPA